MSEPRLTPEEMKCPACKSAMEAIGSPIGDWRPFWCPDCGTVWNEGWTPKRYVPRDHKKRIREAAISSSVKMTPSQLTNAICDGTVPAGPVELIAETDPNVMTLLDHIRQIEEAVADRDRQLAELREAAKLVCEHGDHGATGETTLKRGDNYGQVFWRGVEVCRLDALAALLPPTPKESNDAH